MRKYAEPTTASSYLLPPERVLTDLGTGRTGLTAGQVAESRAAHGSNVIVTIARQSWPRRYLGQFADWMIVLLLACAVVTGALGDLGTEGVLFVLVLINTLIGFVQEFRAEKRMEALERLVDPVCEAYRGGVLAELDHRNMAFAGTTEATGEAYGVVDAAGARTELER